MKVLHVIPSISERSGGPGQAIIPMCRALRDKGVDVLLATTDAGMVGKGQGAKGKDYWKDVPHDLLSRAVGPVVEILTAFRKVA